MGRASSAHCGYTVDTRYRGVKGGERRTPAGLPRVDRRDALGEGDWADITRTADVPLGTTGARGAPVRASGNCMLERLTVVVVKQMGGNGMRRRMNRKTNQSPEARHRA